MDDKSDKDQDLTESLNNHTEGLTLDTSGEDIITTSAQCDATTNSNPKETEQEPDKASRPKLALSVSVSQSESSHQDPLSTATDTDTTNSLSCSSHSCDNILSPFSYKTDDASSADSISVNDSGVCLLGTPTPSECNNSKCQTSDTDSNGDDVSNLAQPQHQPQPRPRPTQVIDTSPESNHRNHSTNTSPGIDHTVMPVNYDTDDSGPWDSYDVTTPEDQEPHIEDENESESEQTDSQLNVSGPTRRKRRRRLLSLNTSSDPDESGQEERNESQDEEDETHVSTDDDEDVNDVKSAEARTGPSHNWFAIKQLMYREMGLCHNAKFTIDTCASVRMVQKLRLEHKLEYHDGCVNCLHFNDSGSLLASGSDDLRVCIWDWMCNKQEITFDSGHRSNVFQCKFMPHSGDVVMVTCARDGQIRLAELSHTKQCRSTKKLAQHKGAAHKLSTHPDEAHSFLSCGEDAVIYEIDLRQDKPNKLCTTKENDKKVPLYSIHSNPSNSYELCVGGRDHFIRIYDKRKITDDENGLLKRFSPHHLLNTEVKANVTCAVYSYNGSEIVATYNDDDIYLFDSTHSDGADFTGRFTGHRNNATVKGVNFYGPHSEYIVSGSDCGHIFLWHKETQQIVQYQHADDGGVINVLEPHPNLPYLATSGLDHDVKLWSPINNDATALDGLRRIMKKNRKERDEERTTEGEMDGQMLWFLMQHLRRVSRRQARESGQRQPSESDSDDSSQSQHSSSDNEDDDQDRTSCVPS